jgi:anti-sigma regulatory factor (Ser/Thr protein kinase)
MTAAHRQIGPVPDLATPAATRAPMLRVLPGTPQSVGAARQIARQLLGDQHPATETAELLISELVTNSVMHSKSGAPGGSVTIALCSGPAGILIQVRDDGGPSEPRVAALSGDGAEHGYGLLLVDVLAERWGTISSPEGRITWCRVSDNGSRSRAQIARPQDGSVAMPG